ncbi:RHS repeat-associated protein [Actinoplanes tereljensis]|uniref:Type IV secretion protein Rhs n=1 Tax=Paractinoplanes tereljensis TaxID=571912 RepID=A0A919NGR7_9ACTN|nr:RHS repeat-associated core domain-containing protein [Actinoplanes tereljensis]GIF18173.1 type IV secretion protein Rhs [Actinoplanes tereljensis]
MNDHEVFEHLYEKRRPGRLRAALAAVLATTLVLTMSQQPASASPAAKPKPPKAKPIASVPVTAAKAAAAVAPKGGKPASDQPAPKWPAAGAADFDLSGTASLAKKADTLPVQVRSTGKGAGKVRVSVYDRAATQKAGVRGVLLDVHRTDGVTAAGNVDVSVGYQSFRTAYGADWANRLRLVSLPACALTTPGAAGCTGTPLASKNDSQAGTVSATVKASAATTLVALDAAASGASGSFSATSLQASSAWSAGGNAGNFSWSYPMHVVPSLGGPAPAMGLSYSSQSVDGRHAASNNQPSWIGEGFESWPGFIERRYRTCSEDMDDDNNNDKETGDQCWVTDNATLNLAGHSGELLYNATDKYWHLRSDDGTKVERRTGADNGDNDGEYWVVTTSDGMQYWFGLNKLPGAGTERTQSTWTEPVYGNHPDEKCHADAFKDSWCQQGWRWNLDYIVDLRGNTASYWYTKETNQYARNITDADATEYVRGGYLNRVAYGTRQISGKDNLFTADAPMQITLGVADRCLSSCSTHDAAHWSDVPWDQECTKSPCTHYSPTFWSTKRLATVTTQVRKTGGGYRDVERWTLTHSFPDPGDGTRAGMWLDKIAHQGWSAAGVVSTLPDVELTWVQLSNRVDTIDHSPAMNWMRLTKIRTESGGTINVTYSDPECVAGTKVPTEPSANTLRCYPVRWTPEGLKDPVTDYFHKYVVKTIYEQDNTGGVPPNGSPRVVHNYTYEDPAWHYTDDDGMIDAKDKTWSDWRGYRTVTVTAGDPGEQTSTTSRYFLGMHGDKLPSGTRTVTVTGAGVPTINDEDAYAGMVRESIVNNGPGGAEVSRTVSEPWQSAATATRTINGDTVVARYVNTQATYNRVVLDGGRGVRVSGSRSTFDSRGMAITIDNAGDLGVTGDESCTQNTYEPRNLDAWLLAQVHRSRNFAVPCAQATNPATLTEAQVISDVRSSFDGHDYGVAPTYGAVTKTEAMSAWNSGSPTYLTTGRADFDEHGRPRHSWDALDKLTTTDYTPVTDGPITGTVVTNPLSQTVKTDIDPAWGKPLTITDPNDKKTESEYDGLGRTVKVWQPGRDKATKTPSIVYAYQMRNDAATVVSTATLNVNGDYVTTYALYDGLMRPRQTQAPSPSGGRLLTDTFYDTAGRKVKEYDRYYNSASPGTDLVTATDRTFVPKQTRLVYDGAGRGIATIFQPYDKERWRTTVTYGGDRTDVLPPAGGTPNSTITDAQGRDRIVREYKGGTIGGAYDQVAIHYNAKNQKDLITDYSGNEWRSTFDLLGREVTKSDPDRGTSTQAYDNAGHLISTTDQRGKVVVFQYDAVGRKIAEFDDKVSATARARWTYDTVAKGQLTQSIRYVGTAAYTEKITGYNDNYQPTGRDITIPATETGLNDTYHFDMAYGIDGSLLSTSFPEKGGLSAETVTYKYDEALGLGNRMTTVYGTSEYSYVADTDYNALAEVEQYDLYTGLYSKTGSHVFQNYSRELETGRLTEIRTDRELISPYTVSDVKYSYNAVGDVTQAQDVAASGGTDTQCYNYDYLRRMTQAWTPAANDCAAAPTTAGLGGPAKYWLSWEFDSVGNRTKETDRSTATTRTTDYKYPAAKASQPHALQSTSTTVGTGAATTAAYAYNTTGDMTSRPGANGTQTMDWDSEGRLTSVTDTSGTTTYLYNADGTRLISRDAKGKTLYLPGMEIRFTAATSARTGTRFYTFGGNTIASRVATGFTWLTADARGTAQVAVDPNTQVAQVRRTTPFGTPRGTAVTWPNNKGFVGGDADPTGLTHLGAREYDPALGRFISVDPIWDMTDPQQWNGYSYSNSSPVTFGDPTGTRMDPDEPGCTPGPGGNCGVPAPPAGRPPVGGSSTSQSDLIRELGPSTPADGSTAAHDTAIGLRVLDLQRLYKGAWITVNLGQKGGADLVCWNCSTKAGGPAEVWVWEIKAEKQKDKALDSLNKGMTWAYGHTLYNVFAKGSALPVRPGQPFPTPSASVSQGKYNQIVTVYSDPDATVSNPTGIEYYRTDDFDEMVPAGHHYHQQKEAAVMANTQAELDTKRHVTKAADTVGVKDDPVSGWAIAGGIGVATAAGGWALCTWACSTVAGWLGFGGTTSTVVTGTGAGGGAAAEAGAGASVPELVGAGVGG